MKLFSLEDEMSQDVATADGSDSVEAVVNEAVVEAEQEHPDEEITAVDNAIEAGGDLEHVEEFVEKQEEQGGMDEDTAEAVKIAVEAIACRVGYNPKNIYQLYATESFASSSSRRINTQLTMEGIKDFLKNLWAKIKAFIVKIWDKVKEFWDKHISTVGRLVKKLEALSEKISESSGTRKDTAGKDIKAPSDIARAFRTTSTLSIADVKEYVTGTKTYVENLKGKIGHGIQDAINMLQKVLDMIKNGLTATGELLPKVKTELNEGYKKETGKDIDFDKVEQDYKEFIKKIDEKFEPGIETANKFFNVGLVGLIFDVSNFNGSEATILNKVVGGKKLVVESDETRVNLTLQSGDDSYDSSVDMVIASKKELIELNRDLIKMLNAYIYMKDNAYRVRDSYNKFINNADKSISVILDKITLGDGKIRKNIEKYVSKVLHGGSKTNAFFFNVFRVTKTITISTAQAGVRYITFTLGQYKSAD
jgi:tetratricopeptide (TPR) repeat protein